MEETGPLPVRALAIRARCDLEAVSVARHQARQFLGETGLGEDELFAWELVLAEAMNNAVQYATVAGRNQPVGCDVLVSNTSVEVRVTDHTAGFDLPDVVTLPEDADSEGGRGLYIIKTLTDEALYLRSPQENCLVLRKARPTGRAQARFSDPHQELGETRHTLDLMTEELASCYESLAAIFGASSELEKGIPSDEFAQRWLGQLLKITESDWFVLRLAGGDGAALRVAASWPANWPAPPLTLGRDAGTSPSVERQAATGRKDVWFDAGNPLRAGDPLAEIAPQGTGFAHAIAVNETLVGVLTVGRTSSERQYAAGEVSVIQTFGEFLGIQIRNAQFQEEQVRTRLLRRDLEIAANIQRSLLPERLPELPGFRLAGYYRSARQVGGDYYDVLDTTDGNLLLVVADVMGKGLPAAMFASIFRSLVRSRRDLAAQPGEFLAWLNRNLGGDLSHLEMFITAQLVFVDLARRRLRVAGAGHQPLLLTGAGVPLVEIDSSGPPLGIVPDLAYPETEQTLPRHARLLMFTDGLSEARNAQGEFLDLPPLTEWLQASARRKETAEQAQQSLVTLLRNFEQDTPPADDQAFILLVEEPQTIT